MRARIFNVHHDEPWAATPRPDLFEDYVLARRPEVNPSYAEMRCHHWVWKNLHELKLDYVGFQHYRRWLRWDRGPSVELCRNEFYTTTKSLAAQADALIKTTSAAAIVPARVQLDCPLGDHFARSHGSEPWAVLREEMVKSRYSQRDFDSTLLTPCNMFLMRADVFHDYMTHWRALMSAVEERVEVPASGGNARLLGFMSERVLSSWLARLEEVAVVERVGVLSTTRD